MAIQSCFDFSQLDTIAPSFDHAVAAPQIGVIAVRRLDNDVTGLVPPAAGLVLVKRAIGLLGQRPVALHDAAASDAKFSLVAPRDLATGLVENPSFEMRTHLADGKGDAALLRDRQRDLVERADVGLGR